MMKFQTKQAQQATFCARLPLLFNIRTCKFLLSIRLPSQRHFPAVLTSRGGHVSCGGGSTERKRQWNFPQQSWGVPRKSEPAVRQPSPSASERQSKATGVLSKQFRFIVISSWFRQAGGVLRGTFHSSTNQGKGQITTCLHHDRGLWWSRAVHVHGNQESQSKILTNNLSHALISSARHHLSSKPQS